MVYWINNNSDFRNNDSTIIYHLARKMLKVRIILFNTELLNRNFFSLLIYLNL